MKVGDERPVPLTPGLRKEYERLYNSQVFKPKFKKLLEVDINKILIGADRYKAVSARTGVPWYVVGIMHLMECDSSFNRHLHNGDPLNHATVNVPKNRPNLPSWTWEDSAVDALQFEKISSWDARGLDHNDWTLGAVLYRLEAWNGFGSRQFNVPTPFLWSGTNFYKSGKYGRDGHWNPSLVSQQLGAAPILKSLQQQGIVQIPPTITPTPPSSKINK